MKNDNGCIGEIDCMHDLMLIKASKSVGPPYDIIFLYNDLQSLYILEFAIAGFTQQQINVQMLDQYLEIIGQTTYNADNLLFLHKGIARRNFRYVFKINVNLHLQEPVQFKDGILRIIFIREHSLQSKRVFKISDGTAS